MLSDFEHASILVLGSGTSLGVPVIGCHCKACISTDPRDRRLRPSVLLRLGDKRILIDTSPDFRYQALHYKIERLDAILYTHSHADHILGLDDVRPFNFMQRDNIPFYASADTAAAIEHTFSYVFDASPSQSSRPRLTPNVFENQPILVAGVCIQPVRAIHGKGTVYGFRFGDCAYLTDHSQIPPESLALLQGLDVLFLDALRSNPHPTHSTVERVAAQRRNPQTETRLLHAYLARPHPRRHRSAPASSCTVGLRRTSNRHWVGQSRLAKRNECPSACMKPVVFNSLEEARGVFGPCSLAIGNFDGVHIGHQALIGAAADLAHKRSLVPAVLTFHPHPTAVVAPQRVPPLICSLATRLDLIGVAGAGHIFVLNFTSDVARLSPEEFVSQILVGALNARAVFVGENFRFGHKQAGTPAVFTELGNRFGCSVHFLPPVSYRHEVVSSTAVRNALRASRVVEAARLLGRCYASNGPVVSGRGIGSKQAVPTLNLRPDSSLITPPGIFVTETVDTDDDRRWPSVTSCGYNPTFGATELTIETYLLSSFSNPVPRNIEVQFRHFLRAEQVYPDAASLKAQIMKDVTRANAYWRNARRLAAPVPSVY